LLWTPSWLGVAWSGAFQQQGKVAIAWSRPLVRHVEVATWNAAYAEEIRDVALRTAIVSDKERRLHNGDLISSPAVQAVIDEHIHKIQIEVQHAMLQEAALRLLAEMAPQLEKEEEQ